MTLADRLREEGKLEGEQNAQLHAFRTAVLHALEMRHGSYPEGIREAIETIDDLQRIEALLESSIRSDSLEEFARKL